MFKAAKSDPIVQECRSLILEDGTWNVVSMAFKRFFNPGEGTAAVIDWDTASAHQKMDGSLLQLFYYKDRWRCSTRGRLDGSGGLSDSSEFKTFGDLFWHLMEPHRHLRAADTLPGVRGHRRERKHAALIDSQDCGRPFAKQIKGNRYTTW